MKHVKDSIGYQENSYEAYMSQSAEGGKPVQMARIYYPVSQCLWTSSSRAPWARWEGLQVPLVGSCARLPSCCVFGFQKNPTNFCLFQKEKRRNCTEEVSVWGFFSSQRWLRHMNENETFCVEKQPQVCLLGMALGVLKVVALFCSKKSIFL